MGVCVTIRQLHMKACVFALFCVTCLTIPLNLNAQAPLDVGTTVNGFQDDFDLPSLNPHWVVRGLNVYSVMNGVLRVTSAASDPNHLLYEAPGYNNSVQEVLARIRILDFSTGDAARAGIATVVDPASSQGINLHFRDEPVAGQRHMEFLDDARAWGTEFAFNWQNNTWYWLRMRHEPNAPSQGGVNDAFMKTWLADGTQAEPASWQSVYDYIPARTARLGFAGIVAGSLGGTSEFEVDYVLIKASGLPSITVAPNAVVQTPVAITNQPQSISVVEGSSATFSVGASGSPRPTFQWYRNDVLIPGAVNASYTVPIVSLSDSGAVFKVVAENVVSNTTHSVTSSNATLSVLVDNTPPALSFVQAIGLSQVQVGFSERITPASGTNIGNYQITNSAGAISISSAALDPSQSNVTLNVSAMTDGASYTLVVNNVRDASSAANLIAPNTTANFSAGSFTPVAIGNPQPSGATTPVPGGLNVAAGGRDIGGTSDQFQFNYQNRVGDFDVKVRIESLSLADAWSEAGLLAREDLTAGGRFASVMATPSISGSYFQYRNTANGNAALTGTFPVNYPNTWLRLQRVGNQFTGYAGLDGQNWTALGSVAIAMPSSIFLGFAASSHNTNQVTTAGFRDFSNVSSAGVNSAPLPSEPLGQSSRRTSLVFSEIMYNPIDRADGKNLEFVELFNSLAEPQDISGWRLDGDADFTFPPNTVIPGGAFLVIAQFPSHVQSVYGITGVLGPFSNTNSLPNTSGTITLRNRIGAVFLEANYDSEAPWPASADGAGHSLVLARPSYGEANVNAWAASDSMGGSPGRLDPITPDPLRSVVINEFLANTDDPEPDFVELYNTSSQAVDISGCFLTDSRNTNKFTIPPNTILGPRAFISFDQTQLGFALSTGGEGIYFRNPANTRVLDAVRFGPQANGVSAGRCPDGADGPLRPLASKTPGTNNTACLVSDIVINEIMYHPISGDDNDQYIELHNRGASAVDLAGWKLMDGVGFTFPANSIIPAGGYVVIAENREQLLAKYTNLGSANLFGNFDGRLSHSSERIILTRPELDDTGAILDVFADEVTYRDGGRWGQWSDGGGSSLELIDPRSDNRLAPNWADSDERAKAPWTIVSVRGVLDNGTSAADQLQVLLQGKGECLIDDVEVLNASLVNVIANSTFETGSGGWTAEGTQSASSLETAEGYNSARSYHVRAADRGDNQINRIRTPLTAGQSANTQNTIRAKVRWLCGHPEILFRLRGNWHEAAVSMNLPPNLGTPGARNSRAAVNAPPAIVDVTHHPVVPAANQPVIVTAKVHDPDGLSSIALIYRPDPSTTLATNMMVDNGTGGDLLAGDGIYAATILGQPAGTVVAFRVQASDQFTPAATAAFPNDAPVRECLVGFGETVFSGNFPSYRIWMTRAIAGIWTARHNLDNTPDDITFACGNHRVIYNAAAAYAGSPYIAPGFQTPTNSRSGYAIELPPDDRFLGDAQLQLDWPGGHGNENTGIQEQMAYYIADQIDIAFSHRYFIRLTVNGVTDMARGYLFEAVIQPGADFLSQWSPGDDEGDFFKIDRAFEFSDAGGLIADPEPQLLVYSTPDLVNGGTKKKTEKYRWYWLKRSFQSANDYTNVFVIADALNATSPEPYTSHTEALADVEQWMGIFAVEHIINNFDSWGHDIGKNMYMFKPQNGKWQLYMFDLDWLMLVSPNGPGNYTALTGPLFSSDDPTVTRMYNHPPFRRAYFRAVQKSVDKAFVASKYEAVMDAKYNSLVANGITLCDGGALVNPSAVKTWFSQRRTFLVGQLAPVMAPAFAVTTTNFLTTSNNFLILNGTAPITVTTITLNGTSWPITWPSVNGWQLRVALQPGTNRLVMAAQDANGNPIGGTNVVTAVFNGTVADPQDLIVINEIMYQPTLPDAEFVELFNTSTNLTFNLTDWRFDGLDYTFPAGSLLQPRGYLALAKDRRAFHSLYGGAVRLFDQFDGDPRATGEILTLFRPGETQGEEIVVDRVRYENVAPWPAAANAQGASLQLTDAAQDNARVSNWSDGAGWRKAAFTATVPGNTNSTNFHILMDAAGDLYIDDLSLVVGNVAEAGPNVLRNPGFEEPLEGSWIIPVGPLTNSHVSTDISHSGAASLHVVATGPVAALPQAITQRIPAYPTSVVYTISFWYLPSTNGNRLSFRITTTQLGQTTFRPVLFSPGTTNTVLASLPPYPALWLNEVQAENLNGPTDAFGEREPWVELYNAGSSPISLANVFLSDNYSNLTQWAFPTQAVINPGEFKMVFLDGQPGQSTASELHANFTLQPGAGSVALSRLIGGTSAQILDYFNYDLEPDYSYGSAPDGQPFFRQAFYYVTPGGANNPTPRPAVLYINEWMAQNNGPITDPADGDFDDWIEIFNPSTNAVNLQGYTLVDALSNAVPYVIPAGYVAPAGGYLLIWADGEIQQNRPDRELHVNFALRQAGEAIVLRAPDGRLVDQVIFDSQTSSVSEGRYPDGGPRTYSFLPATPRAPNVAPTNGPPTIQPIANRVVYLGQTANFTVTATDTNQPPQTLTYSLRVGAPFGATINFTNGVFSWRPSTNQAPSTNSITVRVTDNGTPNQSTTATFTITVLRPPRVGASLRQMEGRIEINFQATPGKTYRIEYSDDLSTNTWTPLAPDVTASATTVTITDDIGPGGQRFYRIQIVD